MRRFHAIMLFCIICGLIFGGCKAKERHYGKFTREEISEMGYAKVEGLPEASGGVTLSIMGETVTSDEIVANKALIKSLKPIVTEYGVYSIFQKNARPAVTRFIMSKVNDILIYQIAKKNAPANIDEVLEKAVKAEVDKHVANYGNNVAKAEEAFKEEAFVEMGIVDWEAFRDHKKRLVMTQFYISKEVKKDKPITHGEMVARYNLLKDKYFIWDGVLRMQVIEINAAKLKADEIDSANGETPEEAAVRKAGQLLKQIRDGVDFGEIAKAHSHGAYRKKGGVWDDVTVGSINEPYDVLEKAAENMESDEVSGIIKAGKYVFILKLKDKLEAGTIPFDQVQGRIEAELKLIQQRIEYNKVLSDIVKHAEVKDLDVFTDFCIKRAYEIVTTEK